MQGTAAVPLGALTSSSAGQVPTTGTASLFLGALAVSSTSQALVLGATIQTLDPLDGVASGVIATVISAGSVQATLQACSLVAQGGVPSQGTLDLTLEALLLLASTVPITYTLGSITGPGGTATISGPPAPGTLRGPTEQGTLKG